MNGSKKRMFEKIMYYDNAERNGIFPPDLDFFNQEKTE